MRHVILNFHGIGEPPKGGEPGEARYWITPDQFGDILSRVAACRDRVRTTLTFDDGNASDLEYGSEGLARHGLTAIFFPLADRIGAAECLAADDLRRLHAMGHGIGSHGGGHVDWTALDTAGLVHEFDTARDVLAGIVGAPVTEAAIPFGRYDRRVLRELRSRGYGRIYSSDGGAVLSDRLPLPRTSVRADMAPEDIDRLLTGTEPGPGRLRRRLARLRKGAL